MELFNEIWLMMISWYGQKPEWTTRLHLAKSICPTIAMTSMTSENHLDIEIHFENGKLTTMLYQKPTDTRKYLHYANFHPKKCKDDIPIGQVKRIWCICSDERDFKTKCSNFQLFQKMWIPWKDSEKCREMYSKYNII